MSRTIHKAKYILAEPDLILQNGAVHVSDHGRISRVERWTGSEALGHNQIVDWGNAAIMPGFINCHAHLELTYLRGQIPRFTSFTDWLSQLVAKRRDRSPVQHLDSTLAGAEMALSSGTVLVGDISASGVSWRALKTTKLRKVVFAESLSLSAQKVLEALRAVEERVTEMEVDQLLAPGVSPHSPYSVSPQLYQAVARLARDKNLPLATHVAETRGELQFLQDGTGEFHEFLTRFDALPPDWVPPRLPPVAYLAALGVLDRPALLVHCNYLDRESLLPILSSRSSVVYCPRSHAFFGHEEHPVRQLLDSGVNVALGTDSLASNSTLSLLDEMRFLFSTRKDLKCSEILRMATTNGASAMNFGGSLGCLRSGYWADMAVLDLPEEVRGRNLTAQILEGAGECSATIVGGEVVWRK
jgi:cytosine/adenosine deaminase-related metal-dependent hydrolase